MLRPASSNGVYSRMSGASSTVPAMVKSGAISTMPPTLAAAMMAMTKPVAERSSLRWSSSGISSFPRQSGSDHGHVDLPRGLQGRRSRRHPHVVAAYDRADQEEQAPEGACNVIGVHGDERVDERIGERSLLGVGPPHQPLNDAGIPHRQDVDQRSGD